MYNFLSQVQISPDGKKVAYVATTPDLAKNGYNANLYRIDAESGENACLTNSGSVDSSSSGFFKPLYISRRA